MMRLRAVRELLVEEVAGLRAAGRPGAGAEGVADAADPAVRAAEQAEREREALGKARRRAALVAGLDAVAVAVLFVLREEDVFLTLGRGEEAVFTLGVLVVAVHLGFRLAQYLLLRNVENLHRELLERDED